MFTRTQGTIIIFIIKTWSDLAQTGRPPVDAFATGFHSHIDSVCAVCLFVLLTVGLVVLFIQPVSRPAARILLGAVGWGSRHSGADVLRLSSGWPVWLCGETVRGAGLVV